MAWKASVPAGRSLGVSGYVSSRYFAISRESDMTEFVDGSYMTGSVYRGRPSLIEVGGAPILMHKTSISGYSTHSVLYGRPL